MSSNSSILTVRRAHALSRRALGLLAVDAVGLVLSFWLAYGLRFDFHVPAAQRAVLPLLTAWVLLLKLPVFYGFRQFHILPDFFTIPDLRRLFYSAAYASLVLALVRWQAGAAYSLPRGVIVIDFLLSFLILSSIRLAFRLRREHRRAARPERAKPERRVGIVGAGEAGAILARELRTRRGLGLSPTAFFDDDSRKWKAHLYDIPVVGPPELLTTDTPQRLQLDEIIISMPSAPAKRVREVIELIKQSELPFRTVPSLAELALGQVQVSQLRPVAVEDLLGRPAVELATDGIRRLLAGRCVLVSGAGGSIGSELCRQIAGCKPAELLLVERSEVAMFAIEQELLRLPVCPPLRPLVADVLDRARLRGILEEYHPELIFHAAAHKHVPMMESQPGEAIRNNSLGTAQFADLARECGVERFILISTDKAINPTSVMGATKRLAEKFVQALYAASPEPTRFMAVRFGNVLGSSGSVIPLFQRQIAEGGPVTVTHPEMRRYFMTIPEASMLVLESAVLGMGGEIFVLDMGEPIKIVDLARQMIELSGFRPDEDIPIAFTGLRPGEKLFEELSHRGEDFMATSHAKIWRFMAQPEELGEVRATLAELRTNLCRLSADQLKQLLQVAVPDYTPYFSSAFVPQPFGAASEGKAVEVEIH